MSTLTRLLNHWSHFRRTRSVLPPFMRSVMQKAANLQFCATSNTWSIHTYIRHRTALFAFDRVLLSARSIILCGLAMSHEFYTLHSSSGFWKVSTFDEILKIECEKRRSSSLSSQFYRLQSISNKTAAKKLHINGGLPFLNSRQSAIWWSLWAIFSIHFFSQILFVEAEGSYFQWTVN